MSSGGEARGERLLVAGEIIAGKFRVERVLGEGGMGVVVEAHHLLLDERVALKFLRREALYRPDIVARFAQEARAAAKLKSEHVARVLDVGEEQGRPYMVMEFLAGQDLQSMVGARGPLPFDEAANFVIQAAEGLAEAHARAIVHRDIKPANLFVVKRGDGWSIVKILDFGISKSALVGADLDGVASGPGRTVSLLGSPFYMSPEQIRSSRDVDRRTDIWSLGAVLFELLTGTTPFSASDFVPLCNDIMTKPHPRLRALRPDATEELERVVDRALMKEPADRFQSAGAFALALLPFTTSRRARVVATQAVELTRAAGIEPDLAFPSVPPPSPSSGSLGAADASGSISGSRSGSLGASSSPRVVISAVPSAPMSAMDPTTSLAATATTAATTAASRTPAASRRPYVVGAVVALLSLVGVGLFFANGSKSESVPPSAASASAPPAAPSAPAGRKTFVLMLDSVPSGTEIYDGDRLIGATPFQLTIDNDTARSEPRRMVLRREGYEPYAVVQTPSEENVRVVVPLTPRGQGAGAASRAPTVARGPRPPGAATASAPAGPASAAPEAPAPSPSPAASPADFRMQR